MRAIWILIVTLVLALSSLSQQSGQTCPSLSIDGPTGPVKPGDIGKYKARIDLRGLFLLPVLDWSVSDGTIVSGQGTDEIEVRSTRWTITVTVEVSGLPSGCPNLASETATYDPPPKAEKLGEVIGSLAHMNFNGMIDTVNRDPTAGLYVFLSGTKRNRMQTLERKRKIILENLVPLLDGGTDRVKFVQETEINDKAVFWLVPIGATPPSASR